MTICGRVLLGLTLLAPLASNAAAQTQPAAETQAVPMPPQLVNAKRIFIANGAGDSDPAIAKYTGGADGLYNQLYADIRSLGRYELVPFPSEADVVLELNATYPPLEHSFMYPKFRLEVRDPKTNVLLWSYTEVVNGALLAKNGRKNVAEALTRLADDLKKSWPSS